MTFTSGSGAVGIANMALNKKGMNFVKDKNYEGFFMARSADGKPATVWAVLESYDGSVKYAEKSFVVSGSDWEKYSFDDLIPDADDNKGRFTLELREAGSADFGYVYLQPGEWGRFEGLNVRKDVAEKLKEEGLTVLRMGGGTTSPKEYRWKGMIGPLEERLSLIHIWSLSL